MFAKGVAGWSRGAEEEIEARCEEKAGESERGGVGAMRERKCVFLRKKKERGLFMDMEARPQARAARRCAREGSRVSVVAVGLKAVRVGGSKELVVSGKTPIAG